MVGLVQIIKEPTLISRIFEKTGGDVCIMEAAMVTLVTKEFMGGADDLPSLQSSSTFLGLIG